MTDTYNTPPTDEVLQADEEPMMTVPVSVENIARVDEVPTILGAMKRVYLPAASRAVPVLGRDPRRKRMVLWPCNTFDTEVVYVCIAPTEAEANAFEGVILGSPGANGIMRFEFTFMDGLWARPVAFTDTAGINIVANASSDDTILYVVSEQWAH